MPTKYWKMDDTPKGVSNRNAGLKWLLDRLTDDAGVMYFADDDNTYDLELFEEVSNVGNTAMNAFNQRSCYPLTRFAKPNEYLCSQLA